MILFKFMKNEDKKSNTEFMKRAKEYYKRTYDINLERKLIFLNDGVLKEKLEKIVKKNKDSFSKEWNSLKEEITSDNEKERELILNIFKYLENTIYESVNYVDDIISLIYMGLLHNDSKYDIFSENYIELEENKDIKKELQSVWQRKANKEGNVEKINKESARAYYPTQIISKEIVRDPVEGAKLEIESIPGGCLMFHKVAMSMNNIGLFDVETDNISIKRYSYGRMYTIYEELKNSPIENILLAEYSLGIGYTCQIYSNVLKDIKTREELEMITNLILCGAEIPYFFIRKNMVDVICALIKEDKLSIKLTTKVERIWEKANEIINKVMQDVLKIWWFPYYLFSTEKELISLREYLSEKWNYYYNDDVVYNDYREFFRVDDWRIMKNVEECFYKIEGLKKDKIDEEKVKIPLWENYKLYADAFEDADGYRHILYYEGYINGYGKEVQKRTIERMSKEHFSQIEEKNKRYYDIREEEFEKVRKEKMHEFINYDVKRNVAKMQVPHKYALIHRKIVRIRLKNLYTLRKNLESSNNS